MKKIMSSVAAFFITSFVFAQAPNKMSYQAVIRNSANAIVSQSPIGMRISILQTSMSGNAVYVETHNASTNSNGLVSIEIGGGTVVSGGFSAIDWANGPYFIKTETDPLGGTSYSITGTSQMLSVPYALYAANSGNSTPGPQGPAGPQGPQGIQGAQGIQGVGCLTHYIGEIFGGGVVFHVWKDTAGVEHGLIVATTQVFQQEWSNIHFNLIGTTASSSWDGLNNSIAIANQPGHVGSAAKIALDLLSGGKSDWYLPAIDEINLLFDHRYHINKTLATIPGADLLSLAAQYWTSTELSPTSAYMFYSGNLSSGFSSKDNTWMMVRAIRSF